MSSNNNDITSISFLQNSLELLPLDETPKESEENIVEKEARPKKLYFKKNNSVEPVIQSQPIIDSEFLTNNVIENVEEVNNSVIAQKLPEAITEDGEINLENRTIISMNELRQRKMPEILKMAEEYEVGNISRMLKQDIVCAILKKAAFKGEIIYSKGVLEIVSEGFGFLRGSDNNYVPSPDDVYVSQNQIKKFGLRTGDEISGYVRDPKRTEKYFSNKL